MIDCGNFYRILKKNGVEFFAGIPDSLLKDFCAYIADNASTGHHIITANEGSAVALASGYHLATGKIGMVYMQNSGLGNAVNTLVSLNDPLVYGIPVLLLIGWRGEPGVKDEPQHRKQGEITLKMLETLGIPYHVISAAEVQLEKILKRAIEIMQNEKRPYALVVRKGSFAPYKLKASESFESEMEREEAIKAVCMELENGAVIVSTTGKISRELYEFREEKNFPHDSDFLMIGSMGHCSHIAAGIALEKPERQVFCFDGDGAVIMHMGNLAINGSLCLKNFKHIIFNNSSHDSVGGQPTVGSRINFTAIASSCGYKHSFRIETRSQIARAVKKLKILEGPALLEIPVKKGSRADLGRPKQSPSELKRSFMKHIAT